MLISFANLVKHLLWSVFSAGQQILPIAANEAATIGEDEAVRDGANN